MSRIGEGGALKVLMPSRIVDRNVGGNTTYAVNLEAGLLDRGIAIGRIPAASSAPLTLLQESLTGILPGEAGEVLHYVADTGPLLRTRRPSVVTVHGVASRWISSARTPLQERTWRTRVARAIASTDHVITVSRSSADDITAVFGVDPARITTIPHGIDVNRFAEPVALSAELRHALPDRFALYLGNIDPRKNLVPLIEAFEAGALGRAGLPLVIAGKPAWNAEETMARISAANNVYHLGFVSDSDRTALMQCCELFVFPSLYEGFGFPVLEALAAGAVVVSSRRGSLAELAGPSLGFDGLDAAGIEAGVLAALQDTAGRARCLDEGNSWARRFSWADSVGQHLEVYARVAHR